MASWLKWLARWLAPASTPRVVTPASVATRSKTLERAANERLILDTRRQILNNLAAFRTEGGPRQQAIEAIDHDTLRAAQVVRDMLHDLEMGAKR